MLPQSWYVRTDICMNICMHACTFSPRSDCLCAARHECAHARPPCIIMPTCYRGDIFHACMYARRDVCMPPPRSSCLCPIFPSCVLARSPAVHHRVYSLLQGYLLCMYVCLTLGTYAAAVFRMLVPCLPVSRPCMLARRS